MGELRGVAVLLNIYAHCIDGQVHAANKRITDALGTRPAGSPTPSRPTQAAVRYVPALSTPARLRSSTHVAVAVCYRFVT